MDFEYDIFISYAHIDDKVLEEEQLGWIARFHQALELYLEQKLGQPPKIWRDEEKLRELDYFNEKIVNNLVKAAVLISILS